MGPDEVKVATEIAKNIAKELYSDLGHPAAARIGRALGDALDILLLPLNILAVPAKKAHLILKRNLEDFDKRIASVSNESLKAPPTEISFPLLQKLSYVSDDDIRTLYIELLAKASDAALENAAHPSFINCIDRMSPDEAKMLRLLQGKDSFPFVQLRMIFVQGEPPFFPEGEPGIDVSPDLTGIETALELRFPANVPLYLTNFISLGLLS